MKSKRMLSGLKDAPLSSYVYYCLKKILGPFIRRVWIRHVEGLENLPPDGPVIIAANHASHLDYLCFSAASPRYVHYLAAEKYFQRPLWWTLMILTGQIRVNRNIKDPSQAYCLVKTSLRQGKVIGIFPEGTRSATGELLPARSGVARIAVETGTPIIPVGIVGTHDIWPRAGKYPKWKKAVTIRIGKPMIFGVLESEGNSNVYRAFADAVMLEIAAMTGKTYPRISGYETIKDCR